MGKKIFACLFGVLLGFAVFAVAKPAQAVELDENLVILKQTLDALQMVLNQLDTTLANLDVSQATAVNTALGAMSANLSGINLTLAKLDGVATQPQFVVADPDGIAPNFEVESANLLESTGGSNAVRLPIAQLLIAAAVVAGMIWLFRGAMKAEPNVAADTILNETEPRQT
ncbi:MAG: hypothetical protein HYT03_01800 [Candidatus Harrisonbacteria bacterium]|nr:hypothetical protein [Candidatus Harrisonbacteria bacterium]